MYKCSVKNVGNSCLKLLPNEILNLCLESFPTSELLQFRFVSKDIKRSIDNIRENRFYKRKKFQEDNESLYKKLQQDIDAIHFSDSYMPCMNEDQIVSFVEKGFKLFGRDKFDVPEGFCEKLNQSVIQTRLSIVNRLDSYTLNLFSKMILFCGINTTGNREKIFSDLDSIIIRKFFTDERKQSKYRKYLYEICEEESKINRYSGSLHGRKP